MGLAAANGCARRTVGFDVRDQRTNAPLEGALIEVRQGYVLNPFPPGPIRVRTNSEGLAWTRVEKGRPIRAHVLEMAGYSLHSDFNLAGQEQYWALDPKKRNSEISADATKDVMVYVIRLRSDGSTKPARGEAEAPNFPAASPQ